MRTRPRTLALVLACACLSINGFGLQGRRASGPDLEARARELFKPLPATMAKDAKPPAPDQIRLGKILFYESRISVDGTVSCARCHPLGLYAADGLKTSIGNRCAPNARNAPTILNAAGQIAEHWIGNRTDVEDQARQSVTGPASFGMPSRAEFENKLKAIAGYASLFGDAFPGEADPLNLDNFARAVGAFERTLVTPSPFDAFLSGDSAALTAGERKGLEVFIDVGCASCHSGTYVGGGMYGKFGVVRPYWELTKSENPDEGRFAVTKSEGDRYVFKVPGLRNVVRTPPYFHDGSTESLETAVDIMSAVQLGADLSEEERGVILAFLGSLTGRLAEDALRIPELPASER
jgi:cytochrome c peroxidase